MACIEPKVTLSLSYMTAKVTRIGEDITAQIIETSERLLTKISCTLEQLKVRCSIVCSLAEVEDYLEVTPAEIQWITDDMGVFYDVESNVEWKIIIG